MRALREMAANPATWMFGLLALEYALVPSVRPFAHLLLIGSIAAPLHWLGFEPDWLTALCC